MHNELKLYKQAIKYYRKKNWDLAEMQFHNLQMNASTTELYSMYVDHIRRYREHPPSEDWFGIFIQ